MIKTDDGKIFKNENEAYDNDYEYCEDTKEWSLDYWIDDYDYKAYKKRDNRIVIDDMLFFASKENAIKAGYEKSLITSETTKRRAMKVYLLEIEIEYDGIRYIIDEGIVYSSKETAQKRGMEIVKNPSEKMKGAVCYYVTEYELR